MEARDIVKWPKISLLLTGENEKIRSNREGKQYTDKIQPLLDMIQEWIDAKGTPSWAKVEVDEEAKVVDIKIDKIKPADIEAYEIADQIPVGRVAVQGQRGLYRFNNEFYTKKVVEGKLNIRKYRRLEDVIAYLDSLKKE